MDALGVEEAVGYHDRRRLKISGSLLSVIDGHVQKATGLAPYDGVLVTEFVVAQLEAGEALFVRKPNNKIKVL